MEIRSIKSFIDALKTIPIDNDFELFYRGHSRERNYQLIPSIYREENIGLLNNENKAYREILSYLPDEFKNEKTTFDCLVKMQHYSIPTRLLDITKNPLVALYFAAKNHPGARGEVIVFKIPKNKIKHYESHCISIISNLVKRPINLDINNLDTKDIDNFNKEIEIQYLIDEIKNEKPQFLPIINPTDINSVFCVNPKMNNQRILRQEGAFLIFGINNKKSDPASIEKSWILFDDEKSKFLIFKKEKIINELNTLGINERSLFPELEKQSGFLKDKYNFKQSPNKTSDNTL
jgi:hypothetical protein